MVNRVCHSLKDLKDLSRFLLTKRAEIKLDFLETLTLYQSSLDTIGSAQFNIFLCDHDGRFSTYMYA